jgi:L,D-transpeptidase YcbB
MPFIYRKKVKNIIAGFIFLLFVSGVITNSFARQPDLKEDVMVEKFYLLNHQSLFWFSSDKSIKRANEWLMMIESAGNLGFVTTKLQSDLISVALLSNNRLDNIYKEQRDRQITGIVLNFIKDIQEGSISFDYDEVRLSRDSVYINQLLNSKPREPVSKMVTRLDCKDHDYIVLRKYLNDSVAANDTLKYKKIVLSMNYCRYFAVNYKPERIVVNIPEAEARYYRHDFLKAKMRTVVGKKKTPTPTIASYITDIVTFPQWNVPYSIAVKELLPRVQKNENYLEQKNFDVVDAKGNTIDESELNWKEYNDKNFPYFFRQSAGDGNDLGTIKFDLQNPFSIFLHATSWQGAFSKDFRFLSHGCVRLEKPIELAESLLRTTINIKKLKSGKNITESKILNLTDKIPVFLIYMPAVVEGKKVTLLPDVYDLIK